MSRSRVFSYHDNAELEEGENGIRIYRRKVEEYNS